MPAEPVLILADPPSSTPEHCMEQEVLLFKAVLVQQKKPLNCGVPTAAGFWLAVDHPAQAQSQTAPQLPFGGANFSSADCPHIYEQLHGLCLPLNLPRRHDDKISFLSTTVFIYDSPSFGTAFHNSSQENASRKSAYVFISTQPCR